MTEKLFFYSLLFILPSLAYFYSKRAARILLAGVDIFLLLLVTTNVITYQFHQILIIIISLILLANPRSNIALLSIITFISMTPLMPASQLAIVAVLIFLALSAKGAQKNLGLYLLIIIPLTLLLNYFKLSFAIFPLAFLIVGTPPFQKWLSDLYSNYQSIGLLTALVALLYIKVLQAAWSPLFAHLLMFYGALMMLVGVFHCIICKDFSELYSTLHQLVFGLILISASTAELNPLFYYLLLPSILTLSILHTIHGHLEETAMKRGMLEFGGLSTSLRIESLSALTTYLTLFTLVSMSAEVTMGVGVRGGIGFLLIGCILLFAAAASLTAFFRNYTIVFEGLPKNPIPSNKMQRCAILGLLASSLVTALIPLSSSTFLSFIGGERIHGFETVNSILLIVLTTLILSTLALRFVKAVKTESWLTGYTSSKELYGSKSEIFAIWKEILEPLYRIKFPIEKASYAIGKLSPAILGIFFIIIIILGELI